MFLRIMKWGRTEQSLFSISRLYNFTSGSSTRGVGTPTYTSRGSGYSDTEIEKSYDELLASFVKKTGSSTKFKGGKFKFYWGKGIADVAIDNAGVLQNASTAVAIVVKTNPGWTEKVKATFTTTLEAIPSSSTKRIKSINVTKPGVYIFEGTSFEHLKYKNNPVTLSLGAVTPNTASFDSEAKIGNLTISNYLDRVVVIEKGGGLGSSDGPVLTLNAPAKKAGQANKTAVQITFALSSTFNPLRMTEERASSGAQIDLKINKDKFFQLVSGNIDISDDPHINSNYGPSGSISIIEDWE